MQASVNEAVDSARKPRSSAARSVGGYVLRVVSGPDAGQTHRLGLGSHRVGRDASCEIPLSDPTVSGRHLELAVRACSIEVRDADTTAGTWIGQVRISRVSLTEPTRVRLGSTTEIELLTARQQRWRARLSREALRELLGRHVAKNRVCALIEKAARSDAPLLIIDPAGRHAARVAEAVHGAGRRGARPFVRFDCAAAEPKSIGTELFGELFGSADGPVAGRGTALQRAAGGTLLLERIEALSATAQAQLLRQMERSTRRSARRATPAPSDVRVIATSARPLRPLVDSSAFRRDLYLRIAVTEIALATNPATPGSSGQRPPDITPEIMDAPFKAAKDQLLERFERRYLVECLRRNRGNITRAAIAARIGRNHFQCLVKKYQIEARSYRTG